MTPLVDIDLTMPPLPLLAIGLEPGEVLQVVGEDHETVVRRDEEGVLAKDRVPVAVLHQVRSGGQIRVQMSSAEVGKDNALVL